MTKHSGRQHEQIESTPMPAERRFGVFMGPALVIAIGLVDPGNIAANFTAGASSGYLLVWVLIIANALSMFVQYLSAKLGLVTGATLPHLISVRLSSPIRFVFFFQAQIAAAATDIAEVIGGALALLILFGIPLILGAVIVILVSLGMLSVQRKGARTFEGVIITCLAVVVVGFVAGAFVGGVNWHDLAAGMIPRFDGVQSLLIAASMVGTTVMPHAMYLHSGLVLNRTDFVRNSGHLRRVLAANRADAVVAFVVATVVNIAMLALTVGLVVRPTNTDTIVSAAHAIHSQFGGLMEALFGIVLLASGLASASVGSYAGSMIMNEFLTVRLSVLFRRTITAIPVLILLSIGVSPTWLIVWSQVLLSFCIPFALIPLAWFTSRYGIMGEFRNGVGVRALSVVIVVVIVALNVFLVWSALMPAGAGS